MVELEKVSKENISAYIRYEETLQDDLMKYQSRIYPNKSCDILHWYHIKTNNDYIGSIWLEQNTNEDFAVLGIFIADRKYRSKGIGSQAIEKIKEICMPFMLVDKILLRVRAENIRAIACYKKCGFIEEKRYSKSNGIKVIEMVYHHLPQRKQMRLGGYDYSKNGVYFVTIITKRRIPKLSKIVREGLCALPKTELTAIGEEVRKSIEFINEYPDISVNKYAIMPDHIHLLISINGAGGHGDPPLQDIIGRLKSYTTHKYGGTLWQRSFYDHIIRDEEDYLNAWNYIDIYSIKHNKG